MFNFQINKKLLYMKGHYFLFNAGTAPVVPFMSVYAKQLGFSSVVVGIIYTVLPFSGMLAKPLSGAIADRYKCQKVMFLIAQFIAAAMFLAIIFLPGVPSQTKIRFLCGGNKTTLNACIESNGCVADLLKDENHNLMSCKLRCPMILSNWATVCKDWKSIEHCKTLNPPDHLEFTANIPVRTINQIENCIELLVDNVILNDNVTYPTCPSHDPMDIICDTECDSYTLHEFLTVPNVTDGEVYKLSAFWLLLSVYLIAWLGQAVTISFSDTICFQILEDKPIRYGYQRMFGALAWGIFSIASGFLVDLFSDGSVTKNYAPVFGIGVAMILLCIVVSSQIQYTQHQSSPSIIKDVSRLLCDIKIIIFSLWCISVGLCTALMWNFLFWLLEHLAAQHSCDMQNWIKTIEGLVLGIQCLAGELPFFFLSNWILKRIGHVHVMTLVLLVIGARFIFYSVLTNPWHCLPVEFLNGITFGLFYATMTSYASIVAPPGAETTTQGLVGAIFEGIGVSIGSFVAGFLFQIYGGSMTFCIYGVSALVLGVLHALVHYLMRNKSSNDGSLMKNSTSQDSCNVTNNNERLALNCR